MSGRATGAPHTPVFTEARLARGLLLLTCAAQLWLYGFEATLGAAPLNDHVLHQGLVRSIAEAMTGPGSPLDPWVPYWGQGFPVLRYYQSLPHLLLACVHRALGGRVEVLALLEWLHVLLLVVAPLSFYAGGRLLGLGRLASALTGVCWALAMADRAQRHFLGLQPQVFLWDGPGLFTQEVALCLLAPAIGAGYRYVVRGRGLALALGLATALWWSHLLLGYFAALLVALALFVPDLRVALRGRSARLGIYAGCLIVTTAYYSLPLLLEGDWVTRSVYEPKVYWDSFGASTVLGAFFGGGLLDGDRFPVLSVLAVVGAGLALFTRGEDRGVGRFLVLALVASLLLFFGRPTWGGLLALLPMSGKLPLHRAICVVQYAALFCAGIGLAALFRVIATRDWLEGSRGPLLGMLATLLLLAPAMQQVSAQRAVRLDMMQKHVLGKDAIGGGLEQAMAHFTSRYTKRRVRGFSGTSWDWGVRYRLAGVPIWNSWATHGLPSISYMFHTMGHGSEIESAFDWKRRDHYLLFNVGSVLVPSERLLQPFMKQVASYPHFIAAEVETRGMISFVGVDGQVKLDPDDHEGLLNYKRAFVQSDWHDNRRHVAITLERGARTPTPVFPKTGEDWKPPRGRLLAARGRVDDLAARVRVDRPAHLMLRATMHPGFVAKVDGRQVQPVMLAPAFVGVPLPAGEHSVRIEYRQSALKLPLLLLTVLLLLGVTLVERRTRRSPDAA